MKKLFCFLIAIFSLSHLCAQSLEFVSLKQDVNDLDAQKYPVYYGDGDDKHVCALVKVQLPLQGVVFENDFVIGDPLFKVNEYWVYMADGAAKLDVKHPSCPKLSVSFGIKLESKMTYVLVLKAEGFGTTSNEPVVVRPVIKEEKEKVDTIIHNTTAETKPEKKVESVNLLPDTLPKKPKTPFVERKFSIYLGPQFQPIGFMGIGAVVGMYIRRFNMEFDYVAGLKKSDRIYWNNISIPSSSSYSYEYTPTYIGGLMGIAAVRSRHFRFTPQVGIGSVMVKGKETSKGTNNPNATNGYSLSAHVGARMDIRFNRTVGIFMVPQYGFSVSESDLFGRVNSVSSAFKRYASGFSGKVGLYLEF